MTKPQDTEQRNQSAVLAQILDVNEVQGAQVQALAIELGYDGPLTIGAVEDGIRIYQRRTVEDCLELGKCLLLLKEMAPHGEFIRRIELLGIVERTGRRFMQAAAKISQNGHLADLSKRIKSVSGILELVTADDDVLEDLSHMDDIDAMTASELRALVREHASGESKQVANLKASLELEQSQVKNLQAAATKTRLTTFMARTEEVREECLALGKGVEVHLNGLRMQFEEIAADHVDAEHRLRMEQVWVAAHLAAARAIDLVESMAAAWDRADMPARILSQHVLTPEEAARWLHDAPLIESRADAEKALREQKRAAEQPRKPGRPKGAANKAG